MSDQDFQFNGSERARAIRAEAEKVDQIAEAAWVFVQICRTANLADEPYGPFGEDGWAWRYIEEALKGQDVLNPEAHLHIEPQMPYVPIPPDPNRRKPMPRSLRTAVFERDEYACVTCGVRRDLSVDHIVPVSAGGSDDLENLQTLCKSHNSSKGAKLE